MLRGLLLALVLLTSAVPAGVCVCELLHMPHDHVDGPSDSDDCPCHCKLSPRETTAPSVPVLECDATAVALFVTDCPIASPLLPVAQFRLHLPPGPDPAHPRYLAFRRLLI